MPTGFGGQSQQRWGDNTVNQNEYMRDVLLTDLGGKVCNTADARKKGMVVLAFFRPSDPVSVRLLPFLQKLADAYKESGKLTVWGVSLDDAALTRVFAADAGITFPLLLDHDGYLAMTYGITDLPTTYLADGNGLIGRKMVGVRPHALNDMSVRVAGFAGVETPVVIAEDALATV